MISFFKGSVAPKDWAIVGGIFFLTLLLIAGFYFGVFMTMTTKIVELNGEYEQIAKNVKKAQTTKENIQELRDEASMYQDLVTKFEARLPEQREIPQMLRQFEAKANAINLQVKLSSMQPIPEENKEIIPFKVSAIGDYHQIVEFINELEREDRYFKITDITINEQINGISESEFIMSTFRFLQQEAAPKDATQEGAADGKAK